jgi:hypothetical protein
MRLEAPALLSSAADATEARASSPNRAAAFIAQPAQAACIKIQVIWDWNVFPEVSALRKQHFCEHAKFAVGSRSSSRSLWLGSSALQHKISKLQNLSYEGAATHRKRTLQLYWVDVVGVLARARLQTRAAV